MKGLAMLGAAILLVVGSVIACMRAIVSIMERIDEGFPEIDPDELTWAVTYLNERGTE